MCAEIWKISDHKLFLRLRLDQGCRILHCGPHAAHVNVKQAGTVTLDNNIFT